MQFYNPGTAIDEKMPFTHPIKDPKEGSTLSYFPLKVGEKDFFDVPSTITIIADEGDIELPVNFIKRVKALFQTRGVILINPKLENILDDDNAAATEKEAIVKGDAMWREHLKGIAAAHYTSVAETKSFGGVPRAAVGLTKYALKFLSLEDPADQVDTITRAKEGQTTNSDMMALMQSMRDEINQLKGAQNARKTT
jgi:hypothetical protein